MMSRLRLFLAWLVLAALPLQGFAAATMLFCGMEQAARVSQGGGSDGHQERRHAGSRPASAVNAHAHAAHAHESHGHAAQGHLTKQAANADPAADATATAGQGQQDGQGQQAHSCPVCASCCHLVAVSGFEAFPQVAAPPGARPGHPALRVSTRTATVPDKPPRA